MSENKESIGLTVLAGCCLGALIGVLLGLSTTPVVNTVLAALLGAGTLFLSLVPDKSDKSSPKKWSRPQLSLIAAFSTAMLIGTVVGLQARSSGWIGQSAIQQQYDDLVSIGVLEETARAAVLSNYVSGGTAESSPTDTGLFSSDIDKCADLAPGRFANMETVVTIYKESGGTWAAAAATAEGLSTTQLRDDFVKNFYEAQCS